MKSYSDSIKRDSLISSNDNTNDTKPYYSDNMQMPALPSKLGDKSNVKNSFKMPFDFSSLIQPPTIPKSSEQKVQPMCKALYDFEAENMEELEFKEGAMIKLIDKLDENWLMGELNNKSGRFPISYVEILVPLP